MTTARMKAVMLILSLAAAVLLAGCIVPLTLAEMLFPKSKVEAKFKLPPEKTVLVFPDDMTKPVNYPPVKRALAQKLNELLMEKKLAAAVVEHDKLMDLRKAQPDFNRLSVATVGRRLGADLVIYVDIEEFSLKETPMGTLWRGRFEGKVRVVDVKKGRLWPDESAGYPVRVTEPTTENTSETYGAELSRKLARRLAGEICDLFTSHYVSRHRPKKPAPELEE
jgi:hypothetical protein